VVRDPHLPSDELTVSFKRLSASSTGSTRSNHSSSSLDTVPVRDSACPGSSSSSSSSLPGKPLLLDLEAAMERLARLQQAVEASVSLLMSFIVGGWRSPGNLEGNLPAVRQASDRVRTAVRDFLEFARGAVANAGQATDRSLQAKLGRQVGKMEEAAKYYRMAADQGVAGAQYVYSFLLGEGKVVERNDEEAFRYMKMAADSGQTEAEVAAGSHLWNGLGCPEDRTAAFAYYSKAADKGSHEAEYMIAIAYAHGAGTSPDEKQALLYMEKAASGGFQPAQEAMATLK